MALTKVTQPTNAGLEQPSLPPFSGTTITDLMATVERVMEVRCVRCGGKLEVPEDCPMPESILCGQCDWLEGR